MSDIYDLARRLVEAPQWAAADKTGVWTVSGWIHAAPHAAFDFISPVSGATRVASEDSRFHGDLPWLNHPATRGWLLEWLQRDAIVWQINRAGVWCEWRDASGERHHNTFVGDDALAAALLAVWGAS